MKQLVLALVATFAAGSAFAQSPTVLVNAGGNAQVAGHTVPAGNSVGADAGDVVTVIEGSAKVTYGNGCAVTVTADASYTVAAKAPVCQSDVRMASSDAKYYWGAAAGAVALGAAVAGGGGDKKSSP